MKDHKDSYSFPKDLTKKIRNLCESRIFGQKSTLFYEGQIPFVAFLIVKGSISLTKRKRPRKIIRPETILGLHSLMNKNPSPYEAIAQEGTEICFIDKTTLIEILNDKHDKELFHFFQRVMTTQQNHEDSLLIS
jgi:CRP-like cAMP-binding protein